MKTINTRGENGALLIGDTLIANIKLWSLVGNISYVVPKKYMDKVMDEMGIVNKHFPIKNVNDKINL